jgi:hypothetical protein
MKLMIRIEFLSWDTASLRKTQAPSALTATEGIFINSLKNGGLSEINL